MKTNTLKQSRLLIFWIYLLAFVLMAFSFQTYAADKKESADTVVIDTSMGKITVKLNPENAPISVENFLKYVNDKHYNGTIFHRVMKDFMIQGGGHLPDMTEKDSKYPPIKNEAKNGLSNMRGTIAMARMNEKDSATAQFFINVVDNDRLDHVSELQYGYAVFGKVISGMDVVDKIRAVSVGSKGDHENVPKKPILIKSITTK
ncbi:MAG: peptidylprolyl isomerase [Bdellovibrionales bacterium RIFCSPHIGHO2_01_FULL_40_29]|nr:MAG: peptidylprolyl isomerase [Bdellovibrionales bacterium RIFCSPHIGHO2_01_FULL_40_29]OFZ35047.1 MAG: peptidylprolyl isomerase [Bdellovibrionales bacterium RIFCSPHIGHO2_02_FULL_40_15]